MPTVTLLSFVLSLASPQEPAPPQAAVRATNELGLALYKALDREQPDKNLFFSPLSIAIAMAMLAEGAREETAAELRRALHLDENTSLADVHAGFQALLERYRGGGAKDPELRKRFAELQRRCCTQPTPEHATSLEEFRLENELHDLRVACSVWVDRAFPLAPAFAAALDRGYGSDAAHGLDIAATPEAARLEINRWVGDRTDGLIRDLVQPRAIDSDTAIVLVNAVLFRGDWIYGFARSRTSEQEFLLADGQRTWARLMHDDVHYAVGYAAFAGDGTFFATPKLVPAEPKDRPPTYPGDDGFTMVELPFKGGDIAMVVIAPRTHRGLRALEARLDAASLATWLTHLEKRAVDAHMLRFERRSTVDLARALQHLGVRRAFTDRAQLGGLTESRAPADRLRIRGVDHQAWIQVTEEGVTATAATTADGVTLGGYAGELIPFTPIFRADRPFVFLIRDVKSGAILFLGHFTDPRS